MSESTTLSTSHDEPSSDLPVKFIPVDIDNNKSTVTDENRCELYDFVEEYSSALHDCLEERFPHDELIAAFTVCEPQNLKPGSDYGVAQIKTLVEHYKSHPLIDESTVYEEWLAVAAIMREWHDRNPIGNMGAFMKYLPLG